MTRFLKKHGPMSGRERPMSMTYRLVAALLFVALLWGQAGGLASAEDTVTGVELSPISSTTIYVNDDAISLTLLAKISGSSTVKDVTSTAVWTSSNSAISVSGGVVTANAAANSVVITGKYSGYTATVTLKSMYRYSSLEIRKNDAAVGSKLTATLGDTLSLTAFGVLAPGADGASGVTDDAKWTTSNSSVATVDGGEVTLVGTGTATITASYQGRSASVALTVESPYKSISLRQASSDGTLADVPATIDGNADDDLQLRAIAEKKSGGTEEVTSDATWTSSNASVVTVDKGGKVSLVDVGTANVTVSYRGVSESVKVVVRTPYEALRTTPDKTLKLSMQSAPAEVTAFVLQDAQSKQDVTASATWTSSDLVVATVGLSNGKMVITPKSAGTATIKASYKGLTREIKVTVMPTVTALKAEKDSLDTYVGETGEFPAVSGETLAGEKTDLSDVVNWKSDNEDIVAIKDGKWSAVGTGTAVLTATLDGGSQQASVTVNVKRKVHMLIADIDSVSIIAGQDVDYPTIRVVYEDGKDDELVQSQVTWKSSTSNVLVTDTKWRGLVASKATMTGTYLNQTVKVQAVVEDEYVSYSIEPASLDLTLNKSKTIKVTGKTKSGKRVTLGSRIQWTASNDALVDVNGASVKGLAEGSGKLTATFQGKTLSVPFTVKAKLTKLTASVSSVELKPGAKDAVKITAIYENGKTIDVTSAAVWSSSSTKIATVAGGNITAIAKGSTTIKASYDGKTVSIRVKVTK